MKLNGVDKDTIQVEDDCLFARYVHGTGRVADFGAKYKQEIEQARILSWVMCIERLNTEYSILGTEYSFYLRL